MAHLRYADLPSLGHVAIVWAARRRIPIGTSDPASAQRALEITLDALPPSLRPAARGWSLTRRNWCERTGNPDPRAAVRRSRGFWVTWLAKHELAVGDRISTEQAGTLTAALPTVGLRWHGHHLPSTHHVWRRHGWDGMNNNALALVLSYLPNGEVLLDIVATRPRAALTTHRREKARERYRCMSREERVAMMKRDRRRRQTARRRWRHRHKR